MVLTFKCAIKAVCSYSKLHFLRLLFKHYVAPVVCMLYLFKKKKKKKTDV